MWHLSLYLYLYFALCELIMLLLQFKASFEIGSSLHEMCWIYKCWDFTAPVCGFKQVWVAILAWWIKDLWLLTFLCPMTPLLPAVPMLTACVVLTPVFETSPARSRAVGGVIFKLAPASPEWVKQLQIGEAEVPESLPSSCSQRWSCPPVPRAAPALCALCYQPWLTNGWQMRLAGWREEHVAM